MGEEMKTIMELVAQYGNAEHHQNDGQALYFQGRIEAAIKAEQDYTRAVIAERDALQAKLQEQALQIISLIGQEIDAEPAPCLTKGQAKAILDLALDLEKTGRLVSLTKGQERSDFVARNRSIQCALEDVLRNLTEPEPTRASLRHDQSEPKAEPVPFTCKDGSPCKHGWWCSETYCQGVPEFRDSEPKAEPVQEPIRNCNTCIHFKEGKDLGVGIYDMECFECSQYYTDKWTEK